jgi:hypothetical protein
MLKASRAVCRFCDVVDADTAGDVEDARGEIFLPPYARIRELTAEAYALRFPRCSPWPRTCQRSGPGRMCTVP